VLMHMLGEPATMQQAPRYRRACLDVYDFLDERVSACETAGIGRRRLIVDPGIGFGKTLAHNLDILSNLDLYRGLGLPLALGVSRKSFIGRLAGEAPPGERLPGSIAAGLGGLARGVSILRVHDVAPMQQALQLWRALGCSSSINYAHAR
jgi:dihydropteroate synthase